MKHPQKQPHVCKFHTDTFRSKQSFFFFFFKVEPVLNKNKEIQDISVDQVLWWCSFSSAYVSYGGLLMRLQGDANNLHGFEVDSRVYLLMKKLAFWIPTPLFLPPLYTGIQKGFCVDTCSMFCKSSTNYSTVYDTLWGLWFLLGGKL